MWGVVKERMNSTLCISCAYGRFTIAVELVKVQGISEFRSISCAALNSDWIRKINDAVRLV